ncbi:MerR family transcriptional regulator [Streptomyces sp. NPDC048172]|uniref:MerR family transcriptional regulator n=1 Tax=Streptomyces sp. NPDC048172 TaxID=3365505 RepID=UPI00371EDF7D
MPSSHRSRLRPVDLARAAGVSPQQIRNYEDAGLLPPVPRTPTGYRAFGPRHLDAVLTYRALVLGHGPETARAVMHAVHADDLPGALALIDAGHAELHEQRRALQATAEALEALASRPPDAVPRVSLRIGDVAALLGVRTSALRVWEAAGLLTPGRERVTGYRLFGPADVRDARLIHMLRQSGYPLPQIRPVLDGLRRTGNPSALRAAIDRRQSELDARARAKLAASARLRAYAMPED